MKEKLLKSCSRGFVSLAVFLLLTSLSAFAQDRTITGKVSDEKDQGLPGVAVTVKGSTRGTNADAEGNYSISGVKDSDVLVFSSIGFLKQELSVGNRTTLDVKMAPDVANLEEVVVTALGISKESRKLGYSVTTIGGEVMTRARETNVANSLAGRVAGLNVKGTSGGPGGTAKILMRGMPSMNSGGSPLIVINGVPMDNTQRGSAGEWGGADGGDGIGNLNPDDIESMTVLKGQAASALFGARASNGVILVKTKAGKKGDFSVDYNMNYSMDEPRNMTDFQYEFGQGDGGLKPTTAVAAQQTARQAWGARLDGSQVIQFDGKNYAYSAQKDNIKNFYRMGSNFTNSVAVTKGGDNGSFRLSVANLDTKSIIENSGLGRKTINLTADQNITKKLSINVMANYIDEKIKGKPILSDGPMNANNGIFLAPNIDQRILAPGFNPETGKEIVFSDDEYVTNPYFVVNQFVNDVKRKRLISAVAVKYQFADWIYAQGRVGYDNANDRIFKVTPWGTGFSQNGKGALDELSNAQRTEINVDGLLGVTKSFGEDFTLDAILGANLRKNQYEKVQIGGGPFVLPYLYSWNNVVNFNRNYEVQNSEVQSAYYSVDLGYKGILNLSTTGRYDSYSTLPSSARSIFTPSVTGSFIFTDLLNSSTLSFGKVRASYARTSGEPSTPYGTAIYYGVGNSFNGVPTGNFSDELPNLFLKPFTKSEVEVGFELKFFGSRLGLDVSYYDQKTKNEIMPATYSSATGYVRGVVGTGSVQNRGLEVMLTGSPVRTSKFDWNVSFNLTSVKNKILSTDQDNLDINLGSNRATLGNAVTAFVVGEAGPQIRAYDYKYHANGQIIVDASGLPVRADKMTSYGSVLPTLYGGLNNDIRLGDFNFGVLVDYNYGNKILSATENYTYRNGLNKATLVGREGGVITGVTESGAPNTVSASAKAYYTALANNVTGISVVDGDFIKLRQLTLGYNLPSKMVEKWPLIRAVNISLVGRNLLYFARETKNIDPEATFGANLRYAGIEGTSLPATRNYGVNVNFKFK
ncbi:SusC/RagA family TonB-linked outer membrane protein [Dyadobacter sp. LJ53]|uniref:SusC/RagA family TonB-linked outer membrane protein n=1 Tax=Dyadobacter chenwenxiniae TaxID=2906456 RepID=UPI001F2E80BB|nr:SusC/RagA family TonB-linked outer membrane protein [Dyadobacter chenwenxiniae]MCF0053356.1 SusC/RagA family TonB-linked outer membrane protein [Dyadobacter chenwenxiniae]